MRLLFVNKYFAENRIVNLELIIYHGSLMNTFIFVKIYET